MGYNGPRRSLGRRGRGALPGGLATAAGLLLAAALGPTGSLPARALELARSGRARVEIRLAAGASPAERTAAEELASYLARATGADFAVGREIRDAAERPALYVGPTRFARERGVDCLAMRPEQWRILASDEGVVLCGGRPRGTLYATYHFLERYVGVRWWTPAAETVPRSARLRVPRADRGGRPAFAYRDIHGNDATGLFYAHNRVNGHYGRLGPEHGGSESYGPPKMVHDFFAYVPPEQLFDAHPELFSEIGGLRYAGGQLCLTQPGLVDRVSERMLRYIEQGAAEPTPPRLYDFSQNDTFRPCECERCTAVAEREGSQSGPLIEFLNKVAARVGAEHPEVLIDTLAYAYTFEPPRHVSARENIVVRLSALYQRDFSRPISDPVNADYLAAVVGWREHTRHLRIWDYPVVFGPHGDLPLPNLPVLAEDFRVYLDLGVEGIFVQQWFPLAGDMRALKRWVLTRLLEDPRQPLQPLIVEFTDGYYGEAGPAIRGYLSSLAAAAREHPSRIGFSAAAPDYGYLDPQFLIGAQRRFDRAERRVRRSGVLLQRVRRARLSLDRATLTRYRELCELPAPLDLDRIVRRYRSTWDRSIARHLPESARAAARAEVEREIDYWTRADRGDPRGRGS